VQWSPLVVAEHERSIGTRSGTAERAHELVVDRHLTPAIARLTRLEVPAHVRAANLDDRARSVERDVASAERKRLGDS
jgi:hypothetical protein